MHIFANGISTCFEVLSNDSLSSATEPNSSFAFILVHVNSVPTFMRSMIFCAQILKLKPRQITASAFGKIVKTNTFFSCAVQWKHCVGGWNIVSISSLIFWVCSTLSSSVCLLFCQLYAVENKRWGKTEACKKHTQEWWTAAAHKICASFYSLKFSFSNTSQWKSERVGERKAFSLPFDAFGDVEEMRKGSTQSDSSSLPFFFIYNTYFVVDEKRAYAVASSSSHPCRATQSDSLSSSSFSLCLT